MVKDDSPADLTRSSLVRCEFTRRQWNAVLEVIDRAPADINIDELRHAVCRARLASYRQGDHA